MVETMTAPASTQTAIAKALAEAGKYLTFHLGGEVYGLEILKVQEIIGMMDVTHVPKMPEFVRGVINLRGQVIPVTELRLKFGLQATEDTEKTCIIVVQVTHEGSQITMGILVDEVAEVMDLADTQIEPPPKFGVNINTSFILGMGKVGQKVVMLLDVDKVLSDGDLVLVHKLSQKE